MRRRRNAAAEPLDAGQPNCQRPCRRKIQHRHAADPRQREHARPPRHRVEPADGTDKFAAVGKVDIICSHFNDSLGDAEWLWAIILERTAGIDHKCRAEPPQLRQHIAVAVETRGNHPGLPLNASAKRLRLGQRTPGNDNIQRRLIGQQPRQPPAKRAIAADDDNFQPRLAHARNRS